ncbi:MAG TPA: DUF4397 domain-containing protein [Streptosporangiaceae bacterium]|nr:DUF4397 domain-containing protein [Streptosporangiaceae bacterium]
MHTSKTVRRFGRLALLIAPASMALGVLAYIAPAASASTGSGWLRLAHLSPNTPAVDVYLYSFHDPNAMIVLHHVAYGTISGYETVPSGEYTVAMRGAGAPKSSPPVLSTTVDVHAGDAYTVAGMGPANGLQLQIFKDRLTTPRGMALVRIIQASLVQHRVTVTAGRKVLVRDLRFAKVTSYVVVPAGTWNVKAAGVSEHTSASISLAAGTIHTIVVLDDPGHLTLDDLVDAAGSRVIPAGAPATGLGGTAPRPAPSNLPWLLLVAGGLLLCAAGARWVIRPWGAFGNRRPPAVT